MNSIELYARAFDLHYQAKDLPAASRAYRELILMFPDSPEKTYAEIQLGTIQNRFTKESSVTDCGKGRVWGIIALALSILGLILIVVLGLAVHRTSVLAKYNARLSEAVGFLTTGDKIRGTELLKDLCLNYPKQILAYKILANRYLKDREIEEAEKILIRMKRLSSPEDDFSNAGFKEIVRLKIEKQKEAEAVLRKKEAEARQAAEAAQKTIVPKKKPRVEEEEFEPAPQEVPAF